MTTNVATRDLQAVLFSHVRTFIVEVPLDIRCPWIAVGKVYDIAGNFFLIISEESPAREARRFKFYSCPLEWLPDD